MMKKIYKKAWGLSFVIFSFCSLAEEEKKPKHWSDNIVIGQSLGAFEKKDVKPAQIEYIDDKESVTSKNIQLGIKYFNFLCGNSSYDCGLDSDYISQFEYSIAIERNKNDLEKSKEDRYSLESYIGYTIKKGLFDGLHSVGVKYADDDVKRNSSISYIYSFVPTSFKGINDMLIDDIFGGHVEFYLSAKYDYTDEVKTKDKVSKKGSASRTYITGDFIYYPKSFCAKDEINPLCKITLKFESLLGYDFSSSGIYEMEDDKWYTKELSLNYSIAKTESMNVFLAITETQGDNRLKFITPDTTSIALKFSYEH